MSLPDADDAAHVVRQVHHSKRYQALVSGGLVAFGVVHLLLAYLAFRLAFGDSAEASQSGALREIAKNPMGPALLIAIAVGFAAIALWQLISACIGHRTFDGFKRTRKRLGSAGRSLMYVVLGYLAARIALPGDDGSPDAEQSLTAQLMALPFGQILVGLIGVGAFAAGAYHVVKGIRDKFEEDLDGSLSGASRWIARVGHVAKGVSIAVVGVLFGLAAISYDSEQAGGLDEALTSLLQLPFGDVIVGIIAAGLAAYGIYCFLWAKHPKFT